MNHIGIDVHLKYSQVCELSPEGELLHQESIPTTNASLLCRFGQREPAHIVLESGPMTPWVRRLLQHECGHDVLVVNPRRVRLIAESTLKNDRHDAELLARLSRFGRELVGSVYQRSLESQLLRTKLRVRTCLVRSRARLIHTVRGVLRAHGYRMRSCPTARFVAHFGQLELPGQLNSTLEPLIETLYELSGRIEVLQVELVALAKDDELALRLQTVPGVGPLVCLAFIAWVDRPERFASSREVGSSLGLRPILRESGEQSRQGRITREGDSEMRRLLVQAAHAALRSRQDSALLRWARQLAQRQGRSKAVVALARKIAVILHRLWVSGDTFRPFPQAVMR